MLSSSMSGTRFFHLAGICALIAISVIGFSLPVRSAHAANIYVVESNSDIPGTCVAGAGHGCTLRQAITAVNSGAGGDTIVFSLTYPAVISLTSQLSLAKDVTINGPGASLLAIDGGGATRLFSVSGGVSVTLNGLTIRNATIADFGGAILNFGGLTVQNSVFTSNRSTGGYGGGAIYNEGPLTVNNSTFTNNQTIGGNGSAGAIGSDGGSVLITGSTFSGNSAAFGSAVFGANGASISISNSTFANHGADGCGTVCDYPFANLPAANATISNSTIANNGGVAVSHSNGTINLLSDVFAGNGGDLNGLFNTFGHNVISNTSGATFVGSGVGDQLNVNANLDPLGNYGSPFQTLRLQPGSPAIGTGDCSGHSGLVPPSPAITVDERGVPRKLVCDSGAFESFGVTPSLLPDGQVGTAYTQTLTSSNCIFPCVYVDPNFSLPPGLTIGTSGTISGTPLIEGQFPAMLTITDGNGDNDRVSYSTNNRPVISFTPLVLPGGTVGLPYSMRLKVTSSAPNFASFSFTLVSGSLPGGLSLSVSGLLSTTLYPVNSEGLYSFTVRATDVNGYSADQAYTLSVAPVINLSPVVLPDGVLNQSYSQIITASGGKGTYSYYILTGSLPTGMFLDSVTGILHGSPTVTGPFTFSVTALDSDYYTGSQTYTLNIASPTSTSTPTATITPTATPTSTATSTLTSTATNTATPLPASRIDTIGIDRGGSFYLRLSNTTGVADLTVPFRTGLPVVGNWTGSGVDTVGVDQNGQMILCPQNNSRICANGANLISFPYGVASGDIPLSGKWTAGATQDGIGMFRAGSGLILLRNALTNGFADYSLIYGLPGDRPLTGNWDSGTLDYPGVYRSASAQMLLATQISSGMLYASISFFYGPVGNGDTPLSGDWTGALGHKGVGLYDNVIGSVMLKNTLTSGLPDTTFIFGLPGDTPLAGHWQALYTASALPVAPVLIPKTAAPSGSNVIVPGDNRIGS